MLNDNTHQKNNDNVKDNINKNLTSLGGDSFAEESPLFFKNDVVILNKKSTTKNSKVRYKFDDDYKRIAKKIYNTYADQIDWGYLALTPINKYTNEKMSSFRKFNQKYTEKYNGIIPVSDDEQGGFYIRPRTINNKLFDEHLKNLETIYYRAKYSLKTDVYLLCMDIDNKKNNNELDSHISKIIDVLHKLGLFIYSEKSTSGAGYHLYFKLKQDKYKNVDDRIILNDFFCGDILEKLTIVFNNYCQENNLKDIKLDGIFGLPSIWKNNKIIKRSQFIKFPRFNDENNNFSSQKVINLLHLQYSSLKNILKTMGLNRKCKKVVNIDKEQKNTRSKYILNPGQNKALMNLVFSLFSDVIYRTELCLPRPLNGGSEKEELSDCVLRTYEEKNSKNGKSRIKKIAVTLRDVLYAVDYLVKNNRDIVTVLRLVQVFEDNGLKISKRKAHYIFRTLKDYKIIEDRDSFHRVLLIDVEKLTIENTENIKKTGEKRRWSFARAAIRDGMVDIEQIIAKYAESGLATGDDVDGRRRQDFEKILYKLSSPN